MAKKPLSAGRIAKLMKNPGTRAALADKYLTPEQRSQRAMNARLDAPVTEGSPLTNRDLAHQRQAATTVQYGPSQEALTSQMAASKQTERDQAGWYDSFLKDLQAHQGNVQTINTAANDAEKGLVGAAGQVTQFQGAADPGVAKDAENAAAIRQALIGSFGGQIAAQGRNSNEYADTLSHVVGPGQKLSAQAQARRNTLAVGDKQKSLADQIGAFGSKFNADTIANEDKNVLARQALNLNVAKAKADVVQNSPEAKGAAAAATSEAQIASKYGMSVHQWRLLGPDGRAARIKTTKAKPADTIYTSGPFAGKKKSEIDALTPDQRQAKVDAYGKKTPKTPKPVDPSKVGAEDFYRKYGIKPASQTAVASAQSSIGQAKTWVQTVLAAPRDKGTKPLSRAEIGALLKRGQAADKKSGVTAIPAQRELWVKVGLDLALPPHRISDATADALHHAGYSVRSLNLPAVTGAGRYPSKGGSGAGA